MEHGRQEDRGRLYRRVGHLSWDLKKINNYNKKLTDLLLIHAFTQVLFTKFNITKIVFQMLPEDDGSISIVRT